MKIQTAIKTVLIWLPSIMISLIFVLNALDKIFHSNQTEKIIENSGVMIITGFFLLLATSLYLYHKTILIGTTLLSLYMTIIVFIHLYKGKPFEVAILIVMATIFAAYIRKPELFYSYKKE